MKYAMIGVMSGTSLDGVDLCRCDVWQDDGAWRYEIHRAATVPYTEAWRTRLDDAISLPRGGLNALDREYAIYLAELINDFTRGETAPLTVASHGHTIHHRPAEGYTKQVGHPQVLADHTGRPVVADFRREDVSLGGQGAPLVPVADWLLFGDAAVCINLGGFANFSFERNGHRLAADVTVCNLLLNRLASTIGLPYDDGGRLAAMGQADVALLTELDALPYFQQPLPKSLGREWFESSVWPLFSRKLDVATDGKRCAEKLLATAVAHIVQQLIDALPSDAHGQVLVTGGGAFNSFLMEGFRQNLPHGLCVAETSNQLIEYKEALAFALLGALRLREEVNVLSSVTGASRDSCSGVIALPRAVASTI